MGRRLLPSAAKTKFRFRPPRTAFDKRDLTIVPGFIDVHIHGAAGHDVMEGSDEAFAAITASVVARGTTSLVATTVTASEEATCTAVEAVAGWMEQRRNQSAGGRPSAEILGIHFEGPFINARSARRTSSRMDCRAFARDLRSDYLQAAKGAVRILTLAPELPGALDLIAAARKAGVVVSLGHTDASYAEAMAAIAGGARHADPRL